MCKSSSILENNNLDGEYPLSNGNSGRSDSSYNGLKKSKRRWTNRIVSNKSNKENGN